MLQKLVQYGAAALLACGIMLAAGLATSLHVVTFGTARTPVPGAPHGQQPTDGLAWDRGGGGASLGAACKCSIDQLLRDAMVADVEEACMHEDTTLQ